GVLGQLEGLGGVAPFRVDTLLDLGKTLADLGVPAENVAAQVRDIATAAAATGRGDEGLGSIALALARIEELGTVDSRIMRQLTSEGIPAWNILGEAMGKPVDALRKMVTTGQISADQFVSAFHAWAESPAAAKALAESADTISGALAIASNQMRLTTTDALAPLTEELTRGAIGFRDLTRSAEFRATGAAV